MKTFLRQTTLGAGLACAVLLLSTAAYGQADDLSWFTIDGGGITFATGGGLEVGMTIGQPDPGVMTDGTTSVSGGFWFAAAPPTLTVPPDANIFCGDSSNPSNTGQATATDDCDGNPTVTYSDSSSGSHPTVLTRTWTATDDCGNSTSGAQTMTVNDINSPSNVMATPNPICVGQAGQLTASVGPGETADWYTGGCGTDGGGTLVGSGSPLNFTGTVTTTYYARAHNTTTGCESFTCTSVTVTVHDPP